MCFSRQTTLLAPFPLLVPKNRSLILLIILDSMLNHKLCHVHSLLKGLIWEAVTMSMTSYQTVNDVVDLLNILLFIFERQQDKQRETNRGCRGGKERGMKEGRGGSIKVSTIIPPNSCITAEIPAGPGQIKEPRVLPRPSLWMARTQVLK